MKKALCVLPFIFFTLSLMAQSSIVKIYAYSRRTISGIREEVVSKGDSSQQRVSPFPVDYFLYVSVGKGSPVSINGVWLGDQFYKASLRKVKTPVVIENNSVVKQKETLVPKTSNDVYAVTLKESGSPASFSAAEKELTQDNEAVFFFISQKKPCTKAVKKITPLTPISAM